MKLQQLKEDGKVYVNAQERLEIEKELIKKGIPYFLFMLSPNKYLIELDMKKIIKKVFGE